MKTENNDFEPRKIHKAVRIGMIVFGIGMTAFLLWKYFN